MAVTKSVCAIVLCWPRSHFCPYQRCGESFEDYFQTGRRALIRFKEKGGKEKDIPVHHKLEEILDEYLKVSELGPQPDAALFPIAVGRTRELGTRTMTRIDAAIRLAAEPPSEMNLWKTALVVRGWLMTGSV